VSNVPVAIVIFGGGALLVWSGLTDPDGGLPALVGAMLRGEPLPKSPHKPASMSGLTGYSGQLGGNVAGKDVSAEGGSGDAATVIAEAKRQLGKPYLWGGNGPERFDCSGLTRWCYDAAGVSIPRVAEQQRLAGKATNTPRPGDLVFFGAPATHCGIVISASQMIHAPHTGDVVKVAPLSAAGHHKPMTFRTYPGIKR
jgi:cell wall-associated NlpC family hydrolase